MAEPSFLSKFSISTPNRYVLYLSGLSFLLSLIIPIQGVDVHTLQKGAIIFIIIGLFNWIFETIQYRRYTILEAEANEDGHISSSVKDEIIAWTFLEFLILIVTYALGIMAVFF